MASFFFDKKVLMVFLKCISGELGTTEIIFLYLDIAKYSK